MKFSYCFLVVALFLNSCSKEGQVVKTQDFSIDQFPQKWHLVKMTGSFEGSQTTGEEMEWQENYIFKSDGSFLKTRNEMGESTSATGQYFLNEEEKGFILEYNESSSLIGNCTAENKEYLYFDENSHYLLSNWRACDGPGLYYERIEY